MKIIIFLILLFSLQAFSQTDPKVSYDLAQKGQSIIVEIKSVFIQSFY